LCGFPSGPKAMGVSRRCRWCAHILLILLVATPSSSFTPRLPTVPSAAALLGVGIQAQWRPTRAPPVASRRPGRMPTASPPASSTLCATLGAKEAVVEAGSGSGEDEAARAVAALQRFRVFYTEQGICPGGDAEVRLWFFFVPEQQLKPLPRVILVLEESLTSADERGR